MVIRKTNTGYSIDISLGVDPLTKKQRRKKQSRIPTKKEAIEIQNEYIRLYHENRLVSASTYNLQDVFNIYIEKYTKNQKLSYIRSQKEFFRNHIQPFFNDTKITSIKFNQINAFQNHLLEKVSKQTKKKLSKNTINKINISLSKIFQTAIKENILHENPCKNLEKLKFQKKDMNFWTIDEFKLFISAIDKEQFFLILFYQVAFLTGLRAGELIALTWNDIDFTKNEIRVNKTASLFKGEYITTPPKTSNSERYVTINQKLADNLFFWKDTQRQFLIDNFQNIQGDLLVFQYNENHPSRDYFSRKIKKIIQSNDLKVKPIRLHDFRHSHVALLIHNGEEPTAIKNRLGHASITTTIDTYGHLYPNKQKSMSDKLDTLF